MKSLVIGSIADLFSGVVAPVVVAAEPQRAMKSQPPEQPIQVAAYYFGNYHVEPRNELVHGKAWSEWELVKNATPRFPGHHQPDVPLWGYRDESDPKVMAQKFRAAADNGIDAFIFDWYGYLNAIRDVSGQ